MAGPECVIGVDFGTLSGRAVVVSVEDGAEVGSAVHDYAHAVIERELPASGERLPPQWALQDPEDYIDVLREAVPAAVAAAGIEPDQVIGIATDFTASTPLPVLADGTPLCRLDDLRERPHAYPKLWKHHAAGGQAERINAVARERGEPWLARYGGLISSEWEFAKGLQILEEDPEVYERMDRFVEAADWIVWQLCGRETRNTCTAGYKGIFQDGGYPSEDYLRALDERFADFVSEKIGGPLDALGARAGDLTAQAAQWTGLPEGIAVAVGNVDAHVTAPAARAIEAGQMLAVMGTSTCHIMNGEQLAEVPGMCGVVRGGVTPGVWGYEAGQSGVGDIFGWFADNAVPPRYHDEARAQGIDLHEHLSRLAGEQEVGAHGLLALDWNNGNRSVLVDHELSGLLVGATLATRPEEVYRALIEATAFGTRRIVEAFRDSGVPVSDLVVAGGLVKNEMLMQIYADVLDLPISTVRSTQGPALGSAAHAAVAAGCFADIHAAAAVIGAIDEGRFTPNAADVAAYDALYAEYRELHDHFGQRGTAMHRLRRIRRTALEGGDR